MRRRAVSGERTPVLAWRRYPNGFFAGTAGGIHKNTK